MKTRLLIIALAAITLLSFTFISTSHSSQKNVGAKNEVKGNQSGFAMQDANQF